MRFRLRVEAVLEADDYADALQRIARHFTAWADDMPSDDPAEWTTDASLNAPTFLPGSFVHVIPENDSGSA